MGKNEFARASVAGPDKSYGQKNDEQYQNTKLISILQEKRKVETRSFHLMWLRRPQPNFEECRTIRESTKKKVKKHTYIFYSHVNIFYYNSNNSNALTERSIQQEFCPQMR